MAYIWARFTMICSIGNSMASAQNCEYVSYFDLLIFLLVVFSLYLHLKVSNTDYCNFGEHFPIFSLSIYTYIYYGFKLLVNIVYFLNRNNVIPDECMWHELRSGFLECVHFSFFLLLFFSYLLFSFLFFLLLSVEETFPTFCGKIMFIFILLY